MRKLLSWLAAWILFSLGHLVSLCIHTRFTGWLYPVYNRLMIASLDVQDWSGVAGGPWKERNHVESP